MYKKTRFCSTGSLFACEGFTTPMRKFAITEATEKSQKIAICGCNVQCKITMFSEIQSLLCLRCIETITPEARIVCGFTEWQDLWIDLDLSYILTFKNLYS